MIDMTNLKKTTAIFLIAIAYSVQSDAQGILGRIKDKAVETVRNKVENKVDRTVDDAVDDVIDGNKTDKKNKNNQRDNGSDEVTTSTSGKKKANIEQQKSDFVPGATVIFEDKMQGEQVGEFPSKWDLVRGNAEIAVIDGEKCIAMSKDDSWISPLMKDGSKNYLGDVFTIEYDMLFDDSDRDGAPGIELDIMHETEHQDNELFSIEYYLGGYDNHTFTCNYCLSNEPSYTHKDGSSSAEAGPFNDGQWHHYALSFNKRAIKFYVDGVRIINVPNAKPGAGWVTLFGRGGSKPLYVKNFRIGKGAVELYGRQSTDISAVERAIAETGKFVTNNILFETGKATLKAESMTEIQKIADYMKANPSARFEVQGHTDNQGNDKINDPLSQQRAEAVVKALEGMGVDGFNLRAVGKGSHEPVADNSTEAGRAKNRRVEFIKK